MSSLKNSMAGFSIESNVHIEVRDGCGVIRKTIDKHNKATQQLVSGILQFIKGDFTSSYRRENIAEIKDFNNAKKYIPCYVGAGTYGIKINPSTGLPDYDVDNRRIPPIVPELQDAFGNLDETVSFNDKNLKQEIDIPTREIVKVMDNSTESTESLNVANDSEQFVLEAEIPPGTYTKNTYPQSTDIFITELGLFPTATPNDGNLLARVVLTKPDEILYVRPQDYIILRWTICIISLGDLSEYITTTTSGEPVVNLIDSYIDNVVIDNELNGG